MRNVKPGTYSLTGELFLSMLSQGCARLGMNRQEVNDLNVFPIPDGDTGDNMCLTIESGCSQASELGGASLGEIAGAASSGMLMGARGNSGVILSRIFAGMAKGLAGKTGTDTAGFARAMQTAVDEAYGSVAHPVEGTILTVVRESTSEAASKASSSLEEYMATLVHGMETSLEHTPEKLQVLADAGVVDSGGAGLLQIFYGFQDALLGIRSTAPAPATKSAAASVDFSLFDENTELEFGYCTEFLLRLQSSKVDLATFNEKVIEDYLTSVGDSVVFFREGSIIKVHVHTKTPGDILSHCQRWGEFLTLKIENMTLQHHNSNLSQKPRRAAKKEFGIVAVASGDGLRNVFGESGADFVIEGGQTMNPSVADFVSAFDAVNARNIFVFPNNSNIIMTARQAAEIYADAHIWVVPTKDLGSGYVAMTTVDPTAGSPEDILATATEVASGAVCGMVSPASRDTEMNGLTVTKGCYIGYRGDTVLSSAATREEAAKELLRALGAATSDIILVFSGAATPASEAEALRSIIETEYPKTEIIYHEGGQAVYDYIFIIC